MCLLQIFYDPEDIFNGYFVNDIIDIFLLGGGFFQNSVYIETVGVGEEYSEKYQHTFITSISTYVRCLLYPFRQAVCLYFCFPSIFDIFSWYLVPSLLLSLSLIWFQFNHIFLTWINSIYSQPYVILVILTWCNSQP